MSDNTWVSRPALWRWAATLSVLGGITYGLFTAVDRVREAAARSR